MQIRLATKADLDAVMRLLDIGRQRMAATGNTQQWVEGYPQRATVEEDLRRGQWLCGRGCRASGGYFCVGRRSRPHIRTHLARPMAPQRKALLRDTSYSGRRNPTWRVCRGDGLLQGAGSKPAYRHAQRQRPHVAQHQKARLCILRGDTYRQW